MDQYTGLRVDIYLLNTLKEKGVEGISRSFLKDNWNGFLAVNGKKVKPSYKLRGGDIVEIDFEKVNSVIENISYEDVVSVEGNLNIIYEDENILVVNKEAGVAVHPGVGNERNTLANYVKYYLQGKNSFDDSMSRSGLVNRLDKPVSGLVLFAKSKKYQMYLQKQFEEKLVTKLYVAEIEGDILSSDLRSLYLKDLEVSSAIDAFVGNDYVCDSSWMLIQGYIKRDSKNRVKMKFTKDDVTGGRKAITYIKPISRNTLLIKIETGRMHQIRATLEALSLSIKGDTLYGGVGQDLRMPERIELQSVLLRFVDMEEKSLMFRLK